MDILQYKARRFPTSQAVADLIVINSLKDEK